MQILLAVAVIVLCYFIGSIPMGYISVKLVTGKDVRTIQSGRTGGTNAMRAAGFGVGLATSLADIAKGVAGVWLARTITPGNIWIEVLAPAVIVLGHNYSIFTLRRDENNRLSIGGGAGGAPSVGGAVGYWWPSFFILVPVGALILFGIGYASVATLSLPVIAAVIFAIRAAMGLSPWHYLIYCLLAEILVLWSLRPNLKRLIDGNERLVGWRARRAKREPKTE
ncbi:MAG: glycerol-3-phosphate acyltransferase [Chloroflexi bacterium]|jgi:acyl phosphate:glycerol-3-phosphate acyltransferase|nr:glycerol-3-phosphate acyltransferase [Chloroflexota bacterium]